MNISAAIRRDPNGELGFTVNGVFFSWEVLEELAYDDTYFSRHGSSDVEPLVDAGLATWHPVGDGSVRGTEKAKAFMRDLNVTFKNRTREEVIVEPVPLVKSLEPGTYFDGTYDWEFDEDGDWIPLNAPSGMPSSPELTGLKKVTIVRTYTDI